jgi:hypothetical protein
MTWFACGFAAVLLGSAPAQAHFALQAPACWMSQNAVGVPLKMAPCGNEGGGTPTGLVTTYQEGQMITVTINETVFHPGHYRVTLSTTDQTGLPAEPVPTANCGAVTVENPPVFPVLADGLFTHTTAFTAPQTVQIKLPDNVTCTHCVLQVLQFMENQPPNPTGCFYHHCSDIVIQAGAVPDGGIVTGLDMSMADMTTMQSTAPMDLAAPDRTTPVDEDMAVAAAAPVMAQHPGNVHSSLIPGCSFGDHASSPSAWSLVFVLAGLADILRRRRNRT